MHATIGPFQSQNGDCSREFQAIQKCLLAEGTTTNAQCNEKRLDYFECLRGTKEYERNLKIVEQLSKPGKLELAPKILPGKRMDKLGIPESDL